MYYSCPITSCSLTLLFSIATSLSLPWQPHTIHPPTWKLTSSYFAIATDVYQLITLHMWYQTSGRLSTSLTILLGNTIGPSWSSKSFTLHCLWIALIPTSNSLHTSCSLAKHIIVFTFNQVMHHKYRQSWGARIFKDGIVYALFDTKHDLFDNNIIPISCKYFFFSSLPPQILYLIIFSSWVLQL